MYQYCLITCDKCTILCKMLILEETGYRVYRDYVYTLHLRNVSINLKLLKLKRLK